MRQIREAVAARRDIAIDILNYRKDGSSFWNALYMSPVTNEEGELLYFFASQLDVSRRRDAEEALGQAQKMEALGQLTGGIAHDFNNLLTVIQGFGDVLKNQIERDGDFDRKRAARSINAVLQAAERGAMLTQQLLAFSRQQTLQPQILQLPDVIAEVSQLLKRLLGATIALSIQHDRDLGNVRADPRQL